MQRAVSLLPGHARAGDQRARPDIASSPVELGPAFNDLRPFARNLDGGQLARLTKLAPTRPRRCFKNEIRPFVRAAREPVPDLARRRATLLGRDAAS